MTKSQRNLAIVLSTGFILLTISFFVLPDKITDNLREPFMMVVGAWIVNMTTIVNYSFGSSAGSAKKTEMMLGTPEGD